MADHEHNWVPMYEGCRHHLIGGGTKCSDRFKCSECGQTATMEWIEETAEPAGEWVVYVPNEDTPTAERLRKFAEGNGLKIVEGDPPENGYVGVPADYPPWKEGRQFSDAFTDALKDWAETQFHNVVVNEPDDWGNMVAGPDAARALAVEICRWFGEDPDASVSGPGYDPRWGYVAGSYGKAIERALSEAGFEIRKIEDPQRAGGEDG